MSTTIKITTRWKDAQDGRYRYQNDCDGADIEDGVDDHAAIVDAMSAAHPPVAPPPPAGSYDLSGDPVPRLTHWVDTSGRRHEVVTIPGEGMSQAEVDAEHDAAVAAMQAKYPEAT